ncbi:metal ABC transporter substrate-binding protein [Cohnella caldifontis]|uniref:metal ABC transporter substrate-binding protein n=1 Tax=Cohnella caldifontis TaxID=3027471 RepID=UPI0023ECE551|nr:metal ABC transporter substrate-binding protein [Cohnella sp. YIM B05605]
MKCLFRVSRAAMPALLAAVLILSGCGRNGGAQAEGKVSVVTTFYPLYFLAVQIGGEDAHVVNLIPTGVEPHDWSPKSRDLQTVSQARLFLYNGAGLEAWTEDFLGGIGKSGSLTAVEASQGIPLIKGASEEADGHGDTGVDPHTWVSPKSVLVMAGNVKEAFVQADPAHSKAYESRYEALKNRLSELDAEFGKELAPYQGRDIVVSHQAFGYLCRDYGLKQVAVMGLSAEAEPRAQDLVDVIRFIKENGIKTIFFEELVSNKLTETIAGETDARMLELNPLEGLSPEQEKAGEDYFSLMRRNLQNLVKALQ